MTKTRWALKKRQERYIYFFVALFRALCVFEVTPFAEAMRKVRESFPRDADVGALYAESLANLRPWDLWTLAAKPQPGTEELVRVLNAVLALDPRHPLQVQKKKKEAAAIEQHFNAAWKNADIVIKSPCLCLPGV